MIREKKSRTKKQRPSGAEQTLEGAVKSLGNLLARAGCEDALLALPELTWIFFLRILDARETREAEEAQARGESWESTVAAPYRWRDWAAPDAPWRAQKGVKVLKFVNGTLLPALRALKDGPGATPRQKLVSEIAAGTERSRISTEKHFLELLDEVHEISADAVADQHIFTLGPVTFSLAQVYEELLLRLGAKASDGGALFTPREIIRAMVRVLDPQPGKTICDPACGTGGFLAGAYEYLRARAGDAIRDENLEILRRRTFYGWEKDAAAYPMALANLALHGIEEPHLALGDALARTTVSDTLLAGAPETFDYILSEPPFGHKEAKEVQALYEFQTPSAQVLYLHQVGKSLSPGGRAGLVMDSSVLSRTDADAHVRTKRQWLDEYEVFAIVHLPAGVLSSSGPSVKPHLVFFEKGKRTDRIWYYDLSDVKVTKKTPLMQAHFDEFFRLLPTRADSERSWTEDFDARWRAAHEQSRPHREAAVESLALARGLEETWRAAHGTMSSPEDLQEMEKHWKAVQREADEKEARAAAIENAIYDLVAVHPNQRRAAEEAAAAMAASRAAVAEEGRTAEQLLAAVEQQGRAVDDALARLKALLAGE